ncbi:MAG: tetratricopeptide repeat protein [bacterium]
MADDDAIAAADQAAEAPGPPPGLDPDDEERHQAIHEILAELRGDTDAKSDEPQADSEPEQDPASEGDPVPEGEEAVGSEPDGVEQDVGPEPLGELPAGDPSLTASPAESPAPHPRQAPQAGLRSLLPLASTPRSLILLHAFFLLAFAAVTWLGWSRVAATLGAVRETLPQAGRQDAEEPAAPQPRTSARASLVPPAPEKPEPVLQVDEGLQYVQAMEAADVHFVKGEYAEAAAGYARALETMPRHWDDGACAYRLAECYLRLRDYPRAAKAFGQVAASYPSHYKPRALFKLGEVRLSLGAYAKAREAFCDLLLLQDRYGEDARAYIERAYFRIADCYRLEAESLAAAGPEEMP